MFCKIVIRMKLHSLIRFCNNFGVGLTFSYIGKRAQSISREVDRWFLSHRHHLIVTQRDTIARCESLNRKSPAEAERKIESRIQHTYSFLINYSDSHVITQQVPKWREISRFPFLADASVAKGVGNDWTCDWTSEAFYLVVSILSSGISASQSLGVTDSYLGDTPSHPRLTVSPSHLRFGIHESRRVPAGDPSCKIFRALFLAPCICNYNTNYMGGCDSFAR